MLAAVSTSARAEAIFTGSGTALSGDMAVEAADGTVRGNNLFHSFRVLNVLTGESLVFNGPDGLRNVISRVTGGTSDITGLKASIIDGPLSVAIPGANFFLINPNGVILGANGFINATGSVFISTADAIKLADGGVFFADPARNSVLTTADPVAFGFLSAAPAPITLDGPWLGAPYTPSPVPPGKTFALVGGDITIQAGVFGGAAIAAPGATVSLASVASAGDALLGAGGVIDVGGFATLGQVLISGGSFINVGDPGVFDEFGDFLGFDGDGSSGSITIRAANLTLSPGGLLAQTFGDADSSGAIDIAVRGDLRAETDPESGFISVLQAGSYGGLGKGPAVRLDVGGTLVIADGSFVISESFGPGSAGDIHIRAGAIEVNGQGPDTFTGISADNYDAASGPALSLTVLRNLTLHNGGFLGTRNFGPGTGGALTITADSIVANGAIDPTTGAGVVTLSLSTETTGGAAGDMTIDTRTLDLSDGARISSSTGGFGAASNLDIHASERLDIVGGLSGIFTASSAAATGNAGSLTVTTPMLRISGGVIDSTTVGDGNAGVVTANVGTLQMSAGAQVRSFSGGFDESNNNTLVVGIGNAGSVNIVASDAVTISGSADGRPSGLLAETRGSGAGGDVNLQAPTLSLSDGATISSSSLGDGNAGIVTANVNTLQMSGGAQISSFSGGFDANNSPVAGSGNAGSVNIVASGAVTISGRLDGRPSSLLAETRGRGAGGDVNLQASTLSLSDGATISSSSLGDGNAGIVTANVGTLQMSGGAQISSFSGGFGANNTLVVGSGNAGSVNVVASGAVTVSGSSDGRPSSLLAETRGSGAGGDVNLQAWTLSLTDGATISSSSLGDGLAGNIRLQLGDSLELHGGASIATRALTSDGGNISLFAPRLIRLVDSQITTAVESGVGGGGNIFIDPQFVLLQDSQIIANAFGGPGGNINIIAGQLIADPATIISASSALGIDGAVNIDAPDTDVSAGLAVLPAAYLDAASLLRGGCGAARAGLSSLVEVGRGGLPPDPGGYLPTMDLGVATGKAAVAARPVPAQRTEMNFLAHGLVASLSLSGCGP